MTTNVLYVAGIRDAKGLQGPLDASPGGDSLILNRMWRPQNVTTAFKHSLNVF